MNKLFSFELFKLLIAILKTIYNSLMAIGHTKQIGPFLYYIIHALNIFNISEWSHSFISIYSFVEIQSHYNFIFTVLSIFITKVG